MRIKPTVLNQRTRTRSHARADLLVVVLAAALLMCHGCQSCDAPEQGPSQVVADLLEGMWALQELSPQGAASEPLKDPEMEAQRSQISDRLQTMFPDEKTREVVLGALMLIRPSEVEVTSEEITGGQAVVTVKAHIGVLSNIHFAKGPAKPREIRFSLVRKKGRWLVSDMEGMLSRAGR